MSGLDPNAGGALVVPGGGASLPTASGAGELPVSDGAGSAYTATSAGDVVDAAIASVVGAVAGQAIVGDFKTIHLLTRSPIEILVFNQHKDYAQRNLNYVRAEMRAMQLFRAPGKLAVVDLAAG